MKAWKGFSAVLIAVFCVATMATAVASQEDTAGAKTSSSTSFEHGNLGLGVIFGEPTGLSAKYWTTESTAIDVGVAWSFSGDGQFHIFGDYLFHHFGLFDVSKGALPVYIGLGGRILFREDKKDIIGVRLPIGIEYYFEDWPLAVYGEVVPILDLTPDTDGDISGGIGVRFYF
jgi:hypothetical protein